MLLPVSQLSDGWLFITLLLSQVPERGPGSSCSTGDGQHRAVQRARAYSPRRGASLVRVSLARAALARISHRLSVLSGPVDRLRRSRSRLSSEYFNTPPSNRNLRPCSRPTCLTQNRLQCYGCTHAWDESPAVRGSASRPQNPVRYAGLGGALRSTCASGTLTKPSRRPEGPNCKEAEAGDILHRRWRPTPQVGPCSQPKPAGLC